MHVNIGGFLLLHQGVYAALTFWDFTAAQVIGARLFSVAGSRYDLYVVQATVDTAFKVVQRLASDER